jgi:hypothetical protein
LCPETHLIKVKTIFRLPHQIKQSACAHSCFAFFLL